MDLALEERCGFVVLAGDVFEVPEAMRGDLAYIQLALEGASDEITVPLP